MILRLGLLRECVGLYVCVCLCMNETKNTVIIKWDHERF